MAHDGGCGMREASTSLTTSRGHVAWQLVSSPPNDTFVPTQFMESCRL